MKHFVGYHHYERMAQGSEDEDESIELEANNETSVQEVKRDYLYGLVTRKKPDRFIGNVIWGIQGQSKPREYFLFDWFIVDVAEQPDGERFTVWLRGRRGISISDGIYLNDESWFSEFRAANSNFSLGLQEIAPKFLDEICKLVKRAGIPLPPDCGERYADVQPHTEDGPASPEGAPAISADRAPSTSPHATEEEQRPPDRRSVTEERIIRDTAVTLEVKRLHNFRCQVCGIQLNTPDGPYAEAAHIRPLGSPHQGPDNLENVLCLCPNHHVLFDRLVFSIGTDLQLIGDGFEGVLRTASGHPISERHLRYHHERFKARPS